MGKAVKLPDIERLFELQVFLHKFHTVKRVVYLPGTDGQAETDTEHTYTLAMTAWYLAQYFPELNADRCIRYALVHDLVEVYAGDTFAFDDKASKSKSKRERQALEQIVSEWQDFPEMISAIHAYQKHDEPESCFIYSLDKIMPPLIIYMDEGYTWKRHNITFEQHHKKKLSQVKVSPQAKHYYNELVKLMRKNMHYFHQFEASK